MKKQLMYALFATLPLLFLGEASMAKELTAQQKKFGDCSHEAKVKGLKGEARKQHMRECPSKNGSPSTTAAPAAASGTQPTAGDKKSAKVAQREKMKTCNADAKAKALKGKERKDFMKQCLSSAGA